MLLNYKGLLRDPKILLFLPSLLETMNIFFNIILPSEQMGSPENFKLWGKQHFWLFSFFCQENLNETIAFSGPGFEMKHFKFNTTVLWGQKTPNQTHPALLNHVVSLWDVSAFIVHGTKHHYSSYLCDSLSSEYEYIHMDQIDCMYKDYMFPNILLIESQYKNRKVITFLSEFYVSCYKISKAF